MCCKYEKDGRCGIDQSRCQSQCVVSWVDSPYEPVDEFIKDTIEI